MADDAANWRAIPLEIFTEGRTDLIDEIFDEGYVEHLTVPGIPPTREGIHMFTNQLRTAFPDVRYEVVAQFQDGDTHIGHVRVTGTMTGPWGPMPATNKSATWEEIHIGRFANGKVVEHWGVLDQLGMLTQLGFIPPMGG
ncbi:MAG TPA: ester cyclase [Acidimicrobiales bacterium]|nr:ester cyclase [Acidimicrobiales bacterium]